VAPFSGHGVYAVYDFLSLLQKYYNAIFGRVGRVASEEVVVELMKKKCLPVL